MLIVVVYLSLEASKLLFEDLKRVPVLLARHAFDRAIQGLFRSGDLSQQFGVDLLLFVRLH